MDYETFDRLHKHSPLMFSLAMEIFLDQGRIAILKSGRDELADLILHRLVILLRESNLRKTVETAEAIARLDTGDLLDYSRRSGYYISDGTEAQDGPFSCAAEQRGENI